MQICIGKTRNTETYWAESGVNCLIINCKLIYNYYKMPKVIVRD